MENRQSVRLFNRSQIALFTLALVGSIYLLVPKRSDIASLRLSGNQVESLQLSKEGLDPATFADEPKLIRKWVELLREDGRTAEALAFSRKLIKLRPKNKLYWSLHLQALDDENQIAEEQATRLKLIQSGMLEGSRLDYLRVATRFRWLKREKDYVQALETLVESGLYARDDVEALLQAYASALYPRETGLQKIEGLVRSVGQQKAAAPDYPVYNETFAALYEAMGMGEVSLRYSALALGLREDAAIEFARGSGPALQAAIPKLASKQLESLIDLSQRKPQGAYASLTPVLYETLRARGALSLTRYFDYVEAVSRSDKKEARRLAEEIPQHVALDRKQWFQVGQLLASLGNREQSIRILKTLLSNRLPAAAPLPALPKTNSPS